MAITFGSYPKNKGSIPFRATNLNAYLRGSDYNFRQKAVINEQRKRKWLWDGFYWPSMPNKKTGENGKQYFIEGKTGAYKKFLKKQANKVIRQSKLDTVGSGANYKRVYDLSHKWY